MADKKLLNVLVSQGVKTWNQFCLEQHLTKIDLTDANLSGCVLSNAELRGADLAEADLSEADLSQANLRRANLHGANIREATLGGTDLCGANLSEADLSRSYMRKAKLSGADLVKTDLSDANLNGIDLNGVELTEANLSNATLGRAILFEANLNRANLSKANLRKATLRNAELIEADMHAAHLWDADLRKADLRKANLSNADLCRADLSGADLRGADTNEARFDQRTKGLSNLTKEQRNRMHFVDEELKADSNATAVETKKRHSIYPSPSDRVILSAQLTTPTLRLRRETSEYALKALHEFLEDCEVGTKQPGENVVRLNMRQEDLDLLQSVVSTVIELHKAPSYPEGLINALIGLGTTLRLFQSASKWAPLPTPFSEKIDKAVTEYDAFLMAIGLH